MKRLLRSLAACAVGVLLAVPISASAYVYKEGGFAWEYGVWETEDEGVFEAEITGVWQIDDKGDAKEWDAASLTVPATLPVRWTNEYAQAERVYDENGNFLSNNYATAYGPEVKSVVATVTEVYADQSSNQKLTSVTIPETVERVEGFDDCTNLVTVTMGAKTEFEHWSFLGTPWLKAQGEFVIRDGVLIAYQGSAAEVVVPDDVEEIGPYAFSENCNMDLTNLVSVTLPARLEEIGSYAFEGCKKLASIDIPASVTWIGGGAFSHCYGLTSATIPPKVKRLQWDTYYCCTSLVSVTLPASLKSIGGYAFEGCTALASIDIPASVESIGYSAFSYCWALASITLPDAVESIGDWAFEDCTALTSINIPVSVEMIGTRAFFNCTNLATVTGCAGVERLGYGAFDATALWNNVTDGIVQAGSLVLGFNGTLPESLTIPEGVTFIAEEAFEGEGNVRTLNLPSTLKTIDYMAFCWSSVSNVTGGAGVTTIGSGAFAATPYGDTFWDDRGNPDVPFELMRLGGVALGYRGVCPTAIVIPDDVTELQASLFDAYYDNSTSNITSVVIGSGVERIGYDAFWSDPNLKTVTGGAALEEIGDSVFRWCESLESVTLGGKLEEMGGGVFAHCDSLQDVTLSARFVELDGFYDCTNLVSVTVNVVEPDEEDEDDDEPTVGVISGAFAECPKLASVKVVRPGFQLTGWSAWGNMDEEIEFADELNTFNLYEVLRDGEDVYYNVAWFHATWKRILRDAANDTPFNNTVASTYIGWITDADGNLVGSVTVKVQKGRNGQSKATATVTLIGAKKVTLTGTIDALGNGQGALAGLTLTGNGLVGTLAVNGVAYTADGARDVAKTNKDPEQAVFNALNKKVWTLVLWPKGTDENIPSFAKGFAGLSVSMGAKGKAKLSGALPDGTKLSVSAQTVVGDLNCCIPFVYTKAKASIGFLVWIDRTGAPLDVTAISDWKGSITGVGAFAMPMELEAFEALEPIPESTTFSVDPDDLPATLVGVQTEYLPVDEPVVVSPSKWVLAKPATVKYTRGVFDQAAYDKSITSGKTNKSALKLRYTSKSGLFSGSFSIFTVQGTTMKKVTANVSGVVCGGAGYGFALIKKHGAIPVWIGDIDDDD